MTADIVNLKRARKSKQRQKSEILAQQNRLSFGRNKNEKQATAANKSVADHKLDQHKRQFDEG